MSFFSLVGSPIGSEDLFIFNHEFLYSKSGKPFFRFDLGLTLGESSLLIRQMRVSGGLIRPPQVRLGRKKINFVQLNNNVCRRLWALLEYILSEFNLTQELRFTKSERMATSRIRLKRGHLERLQIGAPKE